MTHNRYQVKHLRSARSVDTINAGRVPLYGVIGPALMTFTSQRAVDIGLRDRLEKVVTCQLLS